MFTCHFHATYHELGSQPNTPYGDEYPPAYLALIAARNLATALGQGYTGVVGAGGSHHVEPGVGRAIEDGLVPGPRFWPSSRELSTTGHSNDGVPWYWDKHASGAARGDQARRARHQALRDRRSRHHRPEGPDRDDPRRARGRHRDGPRA
jgi:hypothetical protein